MAFVSTVLSSLSMVAEAGQETVAGKQNPAFASVRDDPALPRVLLIGDSISIGYTLPVRTALAGAANVHRIPVNGGTSSNGLLHIDEWLGDSRWDVIHFNWGLHDLWTTEGKPRIPLAQYETNLRKLVAWLKKTNAKLIWCSTTPVPADIAIKTRCNADVLAYNAAAKKVMDEYGVPIDDLYAFALPQLKAVQIPANVHFTEAGSQVLARQVCTAIRNALVTQTSAK
jgi:acyl-CoA thioesterase-1